jgi:hypothetical protein
MGEPRVLIRLYWMYFYESGNSAQLCQNFGIGRGCWNPKPHPPRYATGQGMKVNKLEGVMKNWRKKWMGSVSGFSLRSQYGPLCLLGQKLPWVNRTAAAFLIPSRQILEDLDRIKWRLLSSNKLSFHYKPIQYWLICTGHGYPTCVPPAYIIRSLAQL